ncbi:MAG: hypothetical protein OEY94_06065, partial [Alphaproteobacteria bacterium]|nr:hypothetical protein [Alphaproteobacteria bacterium]
MKYFSYKQNHISESGNILWFLLLTIALLGMLTFIVSRNSGTVNQSGRVEQDRIRASSLLRYTKSIEIAVQRMVLNEGISESDLDFVAISAGHDNTNCNTTSCEVFNVQGGGVDYRSAADILGDTGFANNWHISSGNRVGGMGCDDASANCKDLLLLLEDVPESICLQVNKILNITNPSGALPQQFEVDVGPAYTGSFSTNAANEYIGGANALNESPQVRRQQAGCIYEFGTAQNNVFYYHVLLPR